MEDFNSPDPRDPRHSFSDPEASSEAWITDEEIQALADEREVFGHDEVEQAEKILRENLPAVTHAVVKLARKASSETVRLRAAQYVIDRNLGRITEPTAEESTATEDLLRDVIVRN